MTGSLNLDMPCAVCDVPWGDHTVRDWADHAKRPQTNLPYEELDRPIQLGDTGATFVDNITVGGIVYNPPAVLGPLPGLMIKLYSSHQPTVTHEYVLLLSEEGLQQVRRLVIRACDSAIGNARRARR
jgi:hypothetical protein